MGGMKQGAGEDPFADDPDNGSNDVSDASELDETSSSTVDTGPSSSDAASSSTTQPTMDIPLKFRRNAVKEGRNRVTLYLQENTIESERDARNKLQERFGEDVAKADLREAMVLTALDDLDTVASQLEEWGYGMDFDE
jgi:hypothetical protein